MCQTEQNFYLFDVIGRFFPLLKNNSSLLKSNVATSSGVELILGYFGKIHTLKQSINKQVNEDLKLMIYHYSLAINSAFLFSVK